MNLQEVRERYMSRKLFEAFEEWLAAGKPMREVEDERKDKSGAA